MEEVSIPKHKKNEKFPDGPCWIPQPSGRPVVVCGGCNTRTLLIHHRVDQNGMIDPSINCDECGWHVFGKLEEWDEGDIEPYPQST